MVSQRFYDQTHFVWCTPFFDPRTGGLEAAVPPTSSPWEIYCDLSAQINRRERHSGKIAENRLGIIRGANAKHASNRISASRRDEIVKIVEIAQLGDFRPLIYVISRALVVEKLREPPPEDKAHPLSAEYVIDELPRQSFDIIEIGPLR